MIIITKDLKKKLVANRGKENQKPVMKLFGGSSCTWLISEIDEDGDTMFGLCDIGHGCAELGSVSLKELLSLKFPPFGLPIERDRNWEANKTLSEYADAAREAGRIIA